MLQDLLQYLDAYEILLLDQQVYRPKILLVTQSLQTAHSIIYQGLPITTLLSFPLFLSNPSGSPAPIQVQASGPALSTKTEPVTPLPPVPFAALLAARPPPDPPRPPHPALPLGLWPGPVGPLPNTPCPTLPIHMWPMWGTCYPHGTLVPAVAPPCTPPDPLLDDASRDTSG